MPEPAEMSLVFRNCASACCFRVAGNLSVVRSGVRNSTSIAFDLVCKLYRPRTTTRSPSWSGSDDADTESTTIKSAPSKRPCGLEKGAFDRPSVAHPVKRNSESPIRVAQKGGRIHFVVKMPVYDDDLEASTVRSSYRVTRTLFQCSNVRILLRQHARATDDQETDKNGSAMIHFLPNVKDEPRQWPA